MTRITRLSISAAVMAAGAFLVPAFSNEAAGQISISIPGITRSYYNGYSTHYRPGSAYGYGARTYSGYGSGPYGYGSAVPYGYPSSGYPYSGGYGFRTGTSHSTYYGGTYLRGGSYRPVYRPYSTRYYVPYGSGYRSY